MTTAVAAPTAAEQLLVRRPAARHFIPSHQSTRLAAIEQAIASLERDPAQHERAAAGRQLRDTALALHAEQRALHERERAALDAYEAAVAAAQLAFAQLYKVARVALRGHPAMLEALGFDGTRRRSVAAWQAQAAAFCALALAAPPIGDLLGRLGISTARLRDAQSLLAMVDATAALARRDRDLAQQAALRRNAAFADLDAWYADLHAAQRSRPR